jgi:hypothetical protein
MGMAFASAASDCDIVHIRRWLNEGPTKASIAVAFIAHLERIDLRTEVFRKLGCGEFGEFSHNALVYMQFKSFEVNSAERDSLYAFAELNSPDAIEGLLVAGETENDLSRLCDALKRVVLKQPANDSWCIGRHVRWNNPRRRAIMRLLDPWIADQLRKSMTPGVIESLLVLASIVGGSRTLELLREERDRVARAVPERLLDQVEYEIQRLFFQVEPDDLEV